MKWNDQFVSFWPTQNYCSSIFSFFIVMYKMFSFAIWLHFENYDGGIYYDREFIERESGGGICMIRLCVSSTHFIPIQMHIIHTRQHLQVAKKEKHFLITLLLIDWLLDIKELRHSINSISYFAILCNNRQIYR